MTTAELGCTAADRYGPDRAMVIFQSEAELLARIAEHDELVCRCVRGDLSFDQFCDRYQDFYASYALDGHESDEEERELLEKHSSRIEPHRVIAFEILGRVCSDSDATLEIYQRAGRFGSVEALEKLRRIALTPAQLEDPLAKSHSSRP